MDKHPNLQPVLGGVAAPPDDPQDKLQPRLEASCRCFAWVYVGPAVGSVNSAKQRRPFKRVTLQPHPGVRVAQASCSAGHSAWLVWFLRGPSLGRLCCSGVLAMFEVRLMGMQCVPHLVPSGLQ